MQYNPYFGQIAEISAF